MLKLISDKECMIFRGSRQGVGRCGEGMPWATDIPYNGIVHACFTMIGRGEHPGCRGQVGVTGAEDEKVPATGPGEHHGAIRPGGS